jgi:hypothetical protein
LRLSSSTRAVTVSRGAEFSAVSLSASPV